jgi:hypothetical protein
LSRCHAAGISNAGALLTWGTGQNGELGDVKIQTSMPKPVEKAGFFKSSDVACGNNFTAVCTEAGFLFFFGKKKNCDKCKKSSSFPCTVDELQNDFVNRIFPYNEELVTINDLGDAKILTKCFCVNILPCKSKISEIVSFEGGMAALASDKKMVFLWKKTTKGWITENFLVHFGDIMKISQVPGKSIGIFGKGLKSKSLRRVRDSNLMDCSFRSATDLERVSFEEIVSTMGFKGKIYSMDQGKIFTCIEKVYAKLIKVVMQSIWKHSYGLRISRTSRNIVSAPFKLEKTIQIVVNRELLEVFTRLKKCPKKQLSSFITLSNRFVTVSVEKHWNLWSSLTAGYRKARNIYKPLQQRSAGLLIGTLLTNFSCTFMRFSFNLLKTKPQELKNLSKNAFFNFFLVISKCLEKSRIKSLMRGFHKLESQIFTHISKKSSLSIGSSHPIEVLPSYSTKGLTQPNSLSQSFMIDSEASNHNKSFKKKCDLRPPKYTPSHKMSNGNLPYFEHLSPNSDLSPELKSPSLRSQMSKKMAQKSFQPGKLNSVTERTLKASGSQTSRKSGKESRKTLSSNDPLSPKVFIKVVEEQKSRKSGQKSMEVHTFAFIQKINSLDNFLKKVASRVIKDYLSSILFIQEAKPKVVSWKTKMFSLAFNKFFRVFTLLTKRRKSFALTHLKSS